MRTAAPLSVTTPSLRVHYFEYGDPDGVPVILLHGFPDSPSAYKAVVGGLDLKKTYVLVPYLRGYGPTEVLKPDLVGGQEAALGHDLLDFASALGLTRFHLAGHDWGARAAYAACVFAPERILSLLAIGTPYVMYGGEDYPPEQIRACWYQWYFQLQRAEKTLTENAEAFCHELWRSWSPGWDFSKSEFAEAALAWKNPQFVATVLHYYRTRWGGALSLRAYATLQALLAAKPTPRISTPTIYIQGGSDAVDLPASSANQTSFFSGPYERVVIKTAGHFPHREDPKAVTKLLIRQMERYSR